MPNIEVFYSLKAAMPFLKELEVRKSKDEIKVGSVHTLGALHEGHGYLIKKSAEENNYTIVTVYPNKIQLFPGSVYQYSIEEDIALAEKCGATHLITSNDEEMFPANFCTFIDQGIAHSRLNSSVFPFAARGQITGSIRWINFTRPSRSYFGMKDIEQALLVKRAAQDLLLHTEICLVPCIRHSDGIPISSRLRNITPSNRTELAAVYNALEAGRSALASGEKITEKIAQIMTEHLSPHLATFRLLYVAVVNPVDFMPIEKADLPLILHIAVQSDKISHFDGLCLFTEKDVMHGPETTWLDH